VGFATNILNRHPADLVRACLAVLGGKECPEIKPWINGFLGNFLRVPDAPKSWTIHGKFSIKNTSTVEVTEIPPSFTYEKYETHLENLIQKGTLVSYDDHSAETPHYVLKFRRATLLQLVKRKRLPSILKMQERVGENYTTLDERGSLKIFESPEEIIKYFVRFRLKYYGRRKKGTIKRLDRELLIANNRARFIDEILMGNLVINNRAKKDIEEDLAQMEFFRESGSFNYLLNMAIHSLTKEKADDMRRFTTVKKKELEQTQKTTPDQMYESDLKALLRKMG
jgi:DNA topoisomerase-2